MSKNKLFGSFKKYVHAKRKSNNLCWKILFRIRDLNIKARTKIYIENIIYKYKEYGWRHHSNITARYRDQLFDSFRPVLKTKALKCNPVSDVELHVVSGHFHLTMYLLAVKSLLRFYNNLAVVVHDGDGTFTERDMRILKRHIVGIRIIKKVIADKKMEKMLTNFPKTKRYRSHVVNSFELLDNLALADTQKVITMNSDVLFLKRPTQLIRWIKQKKPPIIYVYEKRPAKQQEFLKEMKCDFPPHFTCALACFYKDVLDFGVIEGAVSRSTLTKTHPWVLGQCIYPLLLNNPSKKYGIRTFDKSRYESSGVFKKGPIFRHYWSSLGNFLDLHIADAKKVIEVLM